MSNNLSCIADSAELGCAQRNTNLKGEDKQENPPPFWEQVRQEHRPCGADRCPLGEAGVRPDFLFGDADNKWRKAPLAGGCANHSLAACFVRLHHDLRCFAPRLRVPRRVGVTGACGLPQASVAISRNVLETVLFIQKRFSPPHLLSNFQLNDKWSSAGGQELAGLLLDA